MGRVLLDNTVVRHPDTGFGVLLPEGSDLPAWAEDLVGDHLLVDAGEPGPSSTSSAGESPANEEPPLGGPGSSREAWAEYAERLGVEVDDEMSRDDIVDAVHNR